MTIEELYKRYKGHIFYLCRKYINNSVDTEDVVQIVFLKAWKALGKFESEHFTWLYRVAVNECLNYLKKYRHETVSFDETMWCSDKSMACSSQEKRLFWKMILRSLNRKEQFIIFLYAVEGLNISEIAEVAGISRQALHKKLNYIMQKLKRKCGE